MCIRTGKDPELERVTDPIGKWRPGVGSENDLCGCKYDGEGVFFGEVVQDFEREEQCDHRASCAEFSHGEVQRLRLSVEGGDRKSVV